MIIFQSLPQIKRQTIREEVLRMYAETDVSYGEIAEVNRFRFFRLARHFLCAYFFYSHISFFSYAFDRLFYNLLL